LVEPLIYGTTEALHDLAAMSDSLAAVVVEPVQCAAPHLADGTWLARLAEVCREHGILLIFDESTSGFRLGYTGGQGQLGVAPDLSTYGKALAGGLPLGALAGRDSVMRLFAAESGEASVFSGSTFGGNPMSVAAGIATLTHLRDHADEIYPTLDKLAGMLSEHLNTYWSEAGLPILLHKVGSMLKLDVGPGTGSPRNRSIADGEDAFYVHVLDRGVAVHASGVMFVSTAHSEADIDGVAEAFIAASEKTAADGFF
jgi:glutamate-1-semialdehyde aminotransferase